MRAGKLGAVVMLAGLMLTGCATRYSTGHTPLAALAVRRAERRAEADGYVPVRDSAGAIRLMRAEELPARAAINAGAVEFMASEYERAAVADRMGLTPAEIAQQYGGWLYPAARIGDGVLITGAAATAGAALFDRSSSTSTRTDEDNSLKVHASASGGSTVIIQVGGGSATSVGGDQSFGE